MLPKDRLASRAELEAEIRRLRKRNAQAAKDSLSPKAFMRVAEWMRNPARKAAHLSFTEGMERQVAYLLESAALPAIRKAEEGEAKARKDAERTLDLALRYEVALRHLAENGYASKDWRFAQMVLNGKSVADALLALEEPAIAALDSA